MSISERMLLGADDGTCPDATFSMRLTTSSTSETWPTRPSSRPSGPTKK